MADLSIPFLEKLRQRKLRISIHGAGYVGLPLALAFVRSDHTVELWDKDESKLSQIAKGDSYLDHIRSEDVRSAVSTGRLRVNEWLESDVHIICVPTPLTSNREPELSFVVEAAKTIAREISRDSSLVILESTTYPGTTREILLPILEEAVGPGNCMVAFSPEREDPGNAVYGNGNTPKLVGAITTDADKCACALYGTITQRVVGGLTPEEAEMAKLLENIFRSVNIAMVNEMKMLCHRMGIDVWKVIDAAKTKPFGYMPFYPGPGLGGHCIPIDPFYLTWRARKFGMATKFIELAGEVNQSMPGYVVSRVVDALNSIGRPVKSSKVLVVGVAYKANVADCRETPAREIMQRLQDMGAELKYHDQHVPEFVVDGECYKTVSDIAKSAPYHCIVIVTAHEGVDHHQLQWWTDTIVDTRRAAEGAYGCTLFQA